VPKDGLADLKDTIVVSRWGLPLPKLKVG